MNTLPLPGWKVLATGIVLGGLGDVLLRASGGPGLNFFIWTTAVVAAAVVLHGHAGMRLSVEARAWLAAGVLFAAVVAWRDAPALKLVAIAAAGVAFALPAMRAGAAWVQRAGVSEYVIALVSAGAHAAFGGALAILAVDWEEMRAASSTGGPTRNALTVARGVALATPFIIVFGALFITADAVFARLVADTLRIDLPTVASHIFVTALLAWIATGCISGLLAGTRLPIVARAVPRGGFLGIAEVGIALGLVAALFATFVIVQFRYLFGGSDLVLVTPALTYADYARRGFFELVMVVMLTLPMLLSADWLLRRTTPRAERSFRALTGALVVLVLAVAVSALQRMRLYLDAYGLTEARFYATALLVLLALVLLWFAATTLRGRRESFAFGTVAAAVAAAAVLIAINPDAVIARTNVARALSAGGTQQFDVVYATSLSADAVPVLISALPALPVDARCRIAQRLLRRWSPQASAPLRSWSWSAARARHDVGTHEAALRAAGAEC